MKDKSVHLFIVGEGDPDLQRLIQKGLDDTGRVYEVTQITDGMAPVLDMLGEDQVPVVIKPAG